jgi:UDP-glucose 4-epimerase
MKNVLLTGGAGFIGSHSALELLQYDYKIIIIDNLSNSHYDVVRKIESYSDKKIEFIKGDLRDKASIELIFKSHQIDSVIHFAGLKSVRESTNNPLSYYQNNIVGAINLFEVMSDFEVNKIVFSSSASVYGSSSIQPLNEYSPLAPSNPYASTKEIIEKILTNFSNKWNIAILRYFNPVGAHTSGLFYENPKGIPDNLMPYISKVALGEYKKVLIFGNDYDTIDGTGIRDYVHIMDIANGHLLALKFINNNSGCNIFNLGSGYGTSVIQLIEAYKRASQRDIPYEFAPRRDGDVAECWADISLAKDKLKWFPTRSLNNMCEDSWRAINK